MVIAAAIAWGVGTGVLIVIVRLLDGLRLAVELRDQVVRNDEAVIADGLGAAGAVGKLPAVDDLPCVGEEVEGMHRSKVPASAGAGSARRDPRELPLQPGHGLGEVRPPEADPDVVPGMPEARPGQEENALPFHELGRERIRIEVGAQPRKAD